MCVLSMLGGSALWDGGGIIFNVFLASGTACQSPPPARKRGTRGGAPGSVCPSLPLPPSQSQTRSCWHGLVGRCYQATHGTRPLLSIERQMRNEGFICLFSSSVLYFKDLSMDMVWVQHYVVLWYCDTEETMATTCCRFAWYSGHQCMYV